MCLEHESLQEENIEIIVNVYPHKKKQQPWVYSKNKHRLNLIQDIIQENHMLMVVEFRN